MKELWGMVFAVSVCATISQAQITKTATFENYTAGTFLGTSFTDPSSGIAFSDSTAAFGYFTINNDLTEFGRTNDLTSGGGWSFGFGFTADLPADANSVRIDISFTGTPPGSSAITLKGFSGSNASGTLISQFTVAGAPDPYSLEITSTSYDIRSFQVVPIAVFTAYDNISYTYLPEPNLLVALLPLALLMRRRCR